MKQVRIKLEDIKSFLEQESGVEDISINTRLREIADLKKAYCKLAKIFTSNSLTTIGKGLREDYKHDKVIYSIRKFDEIYPTGGLDCKKVYDKAYSHFAKMIDLPTVDYGTDEKEKDYAKKLSKVINNFLIEIERRDDQIDKLKSQNLKLKRKISTFNKRILNKI